MSYRYLTPLEDTCYLLWQLEVQLRNMEELGELPRYAAALLYQGEISEYACDLQSRYPGCIHPYELPERLSYVAAHKPLGVARYLGQYPSHGERLLLLDPDIIFREPLSLSALDHYDYHYAADTVELTGYHVLRRYLSEAQIRELTDLVGVSLQTVKARTYNSGGGTYYLKNVTAEFCHKVAHDAQLLYQRLMDYRAAGSEVQAWLAEMWAWLWNLFCVGDVRVHSELAFAWAHEPLTKVMQHKTLHLSGVTDEDDMFNKGYYTDCKSWEGGSFDYATNHDCGAHYYLTYMRERFPSVIV